MKHVLLSTFRDSHGPVSFRIRPAYDLTAPRDRHRYRRAVEQRKTIGRELVKLGRGPLEVEPYTDIDEGREAREESAESFYGMGREFA